MPRIQDDERRFRQAIAKGATPAEAAKARGVNKRSVGMFLRRLGINSMSHKAPTPPPSKPDKPSTAPPPPPPPSNPRRTENTSQAMTAASYGHFPKSTQAKEEKASE